MGICNSKHAKKEKGVTPEQPKGDRVGNPVYAVIDNQNVTYPLAWLGGRIPPEAKEQYSVESTPPCSEIDEGEQKDEMNPWDRKCETWEALNLAINYTSKVPLADDDLIILKSGPTAENVKKVHEWNEECKINGAKPIEEKIEWENPFHTKETDLWTEPVTNEERQVYLDQLLKALYRCEDILYAQ
jgi:hypothetical protein